MIESLPAPVPAVAPEEEGWTQGKPPWLSEAEYAADRCIYRCMKCPHCRKRCSEFLSFWKIEGLRRRYRASTRLRPATSSSPSDQLHQVRPAGLVAVW